MLKKLVHSNIGAAALNMLVAYLVWMLSRVAFFAENWSTFAPYMSWSLFWSELRGALVFDTSALLYVNSLYLALMLFPLHLKESPGFHKALKWLFVVTNAVAVTMNLMDAVYFQYTGRRATISVFAEFANEGNIMSIMLTDALRHWYLVLVFVALVFILWRCYTKPRLEVYRFGSHYYISQLVALLVMIPLAIVGIRGSVTAGTRPITISNANQYVNRPVEASVVLNTPFSMIRSVGKKVFVTPDYMTPEQMEQTYSPVHLQPVVDELSHKGKNVIILIVESMGKEYIGALNPDLDGGSYQGYMPFIDSLVTKSLTFKYSFANGRISMDAMPSILSGLPMMVEPFFLTPASLNDVDGIASMLGREGYSSAFFHGAHNISMGFSAYAHSIGYQRYFGLDEFCDSPKYGGMDQWDGKWAVWDEPFLQFTLDNIESMKQPFLATVFTASSHHPYNVPEQYRDSLKDEGGQPIHKCVRYTDLSLRRFFERASREPWFNNTVFVLVADHTNLSSHDVYKTDLGLYSIPILFYAPDGSISPVVREDIIAQQIDITPTLLHLLGYNKPYLAFGDDLLSADPAQSWAFSYNAGIYQYVEGDLMLQFDGEKATALYRFKTDPLLKQNLVGTLPEQQAMETRLKAIIQQYMSRMNGNRLLPNR
ncbi:MAG: sulfatase-like hydrolase/transferase [Muribaculaceae bacterium]|nr:sulfatase-like hydrolase/transferase [Muribaculaceae bacterium]